MWTMWTVARQLALELNDGTNEERLVYPASRLVNNSMVGGSKFLHFYAPERFPITDSWLQRLSGKPGQGYGLGYYRDYFNGVLLLDAAHTEKALLWAKAFFGYEVSPVRAIEAVAFYLLKSSPNRCPVRRWRRNHAGQLSSLPPLYPFHRVTSR